MEEQKKTMNKIITKLNKQNKETRQSLPKCFLWYDCIGSSLNHKLSQLELIQMEA
uniref:Uncharacterized protein n=1 Tax=Anguilla anguilla TaxID=7936 RepID=A0A0E9TFM6_ANGAN